MEISTMVFFVFVVSRQLPHSSCWNREEKARFFDGAVLFRHNSALQTDILKKIRTLGEIQCSLACLTEDNCVAHTYCEAWNKGKGTCYLHKNGIQDDQMDSLVKKDKCTYQQYINFYEASCTRQCNDRGKCYYDYDNRRYSCHCEPPYYGMHCEKTQAVSFRFTTLGMQGNSGPTSTTGYINTTLQGTVTLDNGIQIWTVPLTAKYSLTVAGASGGDAFSPGGNGTVISGEVRLVKGNQLRLLIGQKGVKGTSGAGGGGGTFVIDSTNNNMLLAAAGGGGGGGGQIISQDGDNGQISESGSVFGGKGGSGGNVNGTERNDAGGGGGYLGNGLCCSFNLTTSSCIPCTCSQGGLSYKNGGLGGTGNGVGGFGGGGAAYNDFPGGGGGYSGGGVHATSLSGAQGGGGGSYFKGGVKASNQQNDADGYVLIAL